MAQTPPSQLHKNVGYSTKNNETETIQTENQMGKARCQDHKQQEQLSNAQSAHIKNKKMQLSVDPEPWPSGDLESLKTKKTIEMLPYTYDKTTKSILSIIMVMCVHGTAMQSSNMIGLKPTEPETMPVRCSCDHDLLSKSPKLVQKCQA